jgi:hypothetical protein
VRRAGWAKNGSVNARGWRSILREFAHASQIVALGCAPRPTCYHLRPFATAEDTVGAWRSLVAHLLWEQRVGGSNPSAPTNFVEMSLETLI